nr:hypothetical protein [Candidatus Parabeggiatoa sp.]
MNPLIQKIKINQYYTRSINLQRDANSEQTVATYIPTTQTLHTLRHIASTFEAEDIPRALALTGPYGSGKSLFSLFFYHLLSQPNAPIHKKALAILKKSDVDLAKHYQKKLANSMGYCRILLTGSPAPLGQCLLQAIYQGAQTFWQGKRKQPPIIKKLKSACETKDFTMNQSSPLLLELQNAVAKAQGCGVLIVIDELGKFLEYQARHPEVNDIHWLQLLAEQSHKRHTAPLHLLVLLHQSFEQYARGLGKKLTDEWLKIQGRFESIAFLESSEQVLRVVKAAFSHNFKYNDYPQIKKIARNAAKVLAKSQALPALDETTATELFMGCYPLHPISLLLLPRLCQKVAQNERTLFSYLGSQERYGFQDSLAKLSDNAWIQPWEIYEYFLLNQSAAIADIFTHHRWMEVITAIERLGDDAPEAQVQLLKTIGLLNIIGSQGGFKPSKAIVMLCQADPNEAEQALTALQKKSCIHYRKFNHEYRVWQGTDFDLNAALREEINQLAHLELALMLNERQPLPPIVARRVTIETGTLRYFMPYFIDATSLSLLKSDGKTPRILFYLAESQEDKTVFEEQIKPKTSKLDIIVFTENIELLRDAVIEVIALLKVQQHYQILNEDPVAQREYKDGLQAAELHEQQRLKSFIETPHLHQWYWQNQPLSIVNKRHLQVELSGIISQIYPKTPIIKNELINREKPSSSANTGRNRLLNGMLNQSALEDLGIEKFPAEKSMYRALLRATGLHQPVNQQWQFVAPSKTDPYHFKPVWQAMEKFFTENEGKQRTINELYSRLQRPPYGVKLGVLPIIFTAYYLAYQQEIALYEENVFCPNLTFEHLELLAKRPEKFTIERFQLTGMRFAVFEKYLQTLIDKKTSSKSATLLDIVRPLAKFMADLPIYTQHTQTLNAQTLAVRQALRQAQSPAQLLFEQLPIACGYQAIKVTDSDNKTTERFFKKLIQSLRELKNAYPQMLEKFSKQLPQALQLESGLDLATLRIQIKARFSGLEYYTPDKEGLIPFIHRLQNNQDTEEAWLESIATFLGRIPPMKWHKEHRQEAENRLYEFSQRLIDLAKLHSQSTEHSQKKGVKTVLIRTVRKGKEIEHLAYIEAKQQKKINEAVKNLHQTLKKVGDHQRQLAVIAELFERLDSDSKG